MENKTNEMGLQAQDVLKSSMTQTFDQLFNQDDKEVDKQIKYHNNKKGKQVQLLAKINSLQMQISKAQTNYRKSLVDPTMDSVDIAISIKTLGEEQKIAESVLQQLFPDVKI